MASESENLEAVDMSNEDQALLRLVSSSSTVYYARCDKYGWKLMRARGTGMTASGPYDNQWVTLTHVLSGPRIEDGDKDVPEHEIDPKDKQPWVLRVGSRHQFDLHVPGGFMDTTDFNWIQRPLRRIERLREMPPDADLTVPESDDPRYRRDSAPDYT